jgi:hypothetical protein
LPGAKHYGNEYYIATNIQEKERSGDKTLVPNVPSDADKEAYDSIAQDIADAKAAGDYVAGLPTDLEGICERFGDHDGDKAASGTLGNMREREAMKGTETIQQKGERAGKASLSQHNIAQERSEQSKGGDAR